MFRRSRRGERRRPVVALLVPLALLFFALGCPNGSEPGAPSTPSGSGGTGGGSGSGSGAVTPTAVCGNGAIESGETCDDGNTAAGDGCSAICQTEVVAGTAAIRNVQGAADFREGPTLRMANYTVPEDGILLVRLGAEASTSNSVTFGGEELIHISSVEVTWFKTISVEMFYLPVTAGRSGAIEVDYLNSGTDEKGMVVATLVGVDQLESFQNSNDGAPDTPGRVGPNLAEDTISTTRANSLVVSAFTAFGSGIPEEVGTSHTLDGYPTVPESDYHEMKMMAGHIDAANVGAYTLGYRNTRSTGYMDYTLIVAVFSDGS